MNRKRFLVIAMLVIVGIGLGTVSAQWMASQIPTVSMMDSLLLSNDTSIKVSYKLGSVSGILIQQADFKELMAEERKMAIDIALSDPEVQKMLNGKEYEIIDVINIAITNDRVQERRVLVSINIRNQAVVNVMVNMNKKTVDQREWENMLDLNRPLVEHTIPLTKEEEQKAVDIALSDPDVRKMLNGSKYNVTRVVDILLVMKAGQLNSDSAISNGTEREYNGEQEINLSQDAHDRHASVFIDVLNESNSTTAYMEVMVNLNRSIMKRLSLVRI